MNNINIEKDNERIYVSDIHNLLLKYAGFTEEEFLNYKNHILDVSSISHDVRNRSLYSSIVLKQEDFHVRLQISAGADINYVSDKGYTPLMAAIYNNDINVISLLLLLGANINARNNNGESIKDFVELYGNKNCKGRDSRQ